MISERDVCVCGTGIGLSPGGRHSRDGARTRAAGARAFTERRSALASFEPGYRDFALTLAAFREWFSLRCRQMPPRSTIGQTFVMRIRSEDASSESTNLGTDRGTHTISRTKSCKLADRVRMSSFLPCVEAQTLATQPSRLVGGIGSCRPSRALSWPRKSPEKFWKAT